MSKVFKMAPTWKLNVEELKRKYAKKYLPCLDLSYLPVNFRGTFRNISCLRKDFTTVEDDQEIHELVMVPVAQHMNLLTALFTREINRNLVQSQISRVLENL